MDVLTICEQVISNSAQLIAELDMAMRQVFGLDCDDTKRALDSFPVLHKSKARNFGEFRSERLVLDGYDEMAEAAETDVPYETPLDPPPGRGPREPVRSS